jgi:hypothetical protein
MGAPHLFCAVLAWSRAVMRFADNERAQTTLAMQARVDAVGTAWRRQLGALLTEMVSSGEHH